MGRPTRALIAGLRRMRRGFTLVELMVALTGGLFVTIAVFLLARQSTELYQTETRIANATVGSVIGFERLRADIARAGYLTTPNIQRDPRFCGTIATAWPDFLEYLSSIRIQATTAVPAALSAAGIAPQEIILAGSYASNDQFPTWEIVDTGSNFAVTLQPDSPGMGRLGYHRETTQAGREALLSAVFASGRILRLVDTTGREQYARIATVAAPGTAIDASDSTRPKVLLANANPAVLFRAQQAVLNCGIHGGGDRTLVNVVNIVKYSIRDVSGIARLAPLTQAATVTGVVSSGAHSNTGRSELVREELDPSGQTIAGTEEVVAEFAVNLDFGIVVDELVVSGSTTSEQLLAFPPGDANVAAWAGDPATITLAARGPQLVRSVRARLSVRSQQADRETGIPSALADGGGEPISPGLYRFPVGGGFARVRTAQSEIAIRSHRSATWL
ncbi:MAG: prepilin-type N-terminal cleavage/methylation domain-containing protein [Deltaproteobacteria bacterium]|nr:prepilin-type N-terminal cleavage/methylation domain-containing protein [Deltaproteobacteria bacterium]